MWCSKPAFVALLVAACGGGAAGQDGGVRLVPEAEIAELKRSLAATMAENRTRVCRRPLLRGQPLEGRADEDMLALIEPTGDLAACLEASAADEVREGLSTGPTGEPGGDVPFRTARPLDDPASLVPAIQQAYERCTMLPQALERAVSHEDSCSPWLTGRRPEPSLRPYLSVCRAVAIRARHLAQEGQSAPAMRHILDAIRLGQDMSRGGPGLILPMIAIAGAEILLPQAELILAEGALSADDASALAAEMDTLIAHETHWSEFLRGEYADLALYMVQPHLEPAGWVPPGGWPDGQGPPVAANGALKTPDGVLKTKSMGLPPGDEEALGWVSLDETTRAKRHACPASATLEACVAGLARYTAEVTAKASKRRLPPFSRNPTKTIRRQVLDILQGVAAPADAKYTRKYALRLARLAAMRLHLVARRGASCPVPPHYDTSPLLGLRRPSALGGTLGIDPASGGVDVAPPPWLAEGSDRSRPLWRIRCPAPGETPPK